jgi:hypothetical protein
VRQHACSLKTKLTLTLRLAVLMVSKKPAQSMSMANPVAL